MKVEKDTWFIAYTPDTDIVHYGFVSQGKQLDSGQPEIEYFDTEQAYIDRLNEFDITLEEDEDDLLDNE